MLAHSETEEMRSLVEAVERVADEKKLSVSGLALYHLIMPMFPGQSFQVLRQRYLKYRGTIKGAANDEEKSGGAGAPLLDERDAGDETSYTLKTGEEGERRDQADEGSGETLWAHDPPNDESMPLLPSQGHQQQQLEAATTTAPDDLYLLDALALKASQLVPHSLHELDVVGAADIDPTPPTGSPLVGRKRLARQTARKRAINQGAEVIVEVAKARPKGGDHKNAVSRNGSPPSTLRAAALLREQRTLIQDIIEEMVTLHRVPREVVLYALLTHSGDIAQASDYLADASREPQWDFRDDLAILEGNTGSSLLQRHTPAEIISRQEFLTRLCDLPPQ